MTVDQQFNILNEKLQVLLKQYNRLKKENEQLKELLQQQKQQQAMSLQIIDQLEQQVSILKFGAGEMNEKDKKEFEKKINLYIKEIDRCIAFLGQ
jgi:hypothetical protein